MSASAAALNEGAPVSGAWPVAQVRADFPILETRVHDKPLVYLDGGASSQKPLQVIEAMDRFYRTENANIHRGVYQLSQVATRLYERARVKAQVLLNAADEREVIFTKGCTEAINLVAQSWGGQNLRAGDVILLSVLEHHSNIVPWQLIAERTGAVICVIPMDERGVLDQVEYEKLLANNPVKLVGLTHVSNALGTVNPLKAMTALAHAYGALVLADGAQAAPHQLIDVQDLDVDFYVVSCHKMYAPLGVGLLYGKLALLEEMPPYQGGGDMIHTVSFERSTYAGLPAKFEAGTPNISGVVGLGAAIDYLESFGSGPTTRDRFADSFRQISAHEHGLLEAATAALQAIPGLTIHGTAPDKSAIISFTLADAHPHDIGTILDSDGVCIRAGHHCCMPLMKRMNVSATARVSFGLYNSLEEVATLDRAVRKVVEMFS